VLKAIILAGLHDKAAKKGIKITREDGLEKRSIKADLDSQVRSQDIIIVPRVSSDGGDARSMERLEEQPEIEIHIKDYLRVLIKRSGRC